MSDECECGQQLRYFGGAGAEGWLCPACDAEHVAELQEITQYQLTRARQDLDDLKVIASVELDQLLELVRDQNED